MKKSREMSLEDIRELISKMAVLMLKLGYNNIDDMIKDLDNLNTLATAFKRLSPLLTLDATAKGTKFVNVREWRFKENETGHKDYYDLFIKAMNIIDNEGER